MWTYVIYKKVVKVNAPEFVNGTEVVLEQVLALRKCILVVKG